MDSNIESHPRTLRGTFLSFAKPIIGFLYLLIGAPGYKSKLITFVFHEVTDEPREHARLTNTYSTKKNFLKQLNLLSSHFNIIDPLKNSSWVNQNGCLITFDDGYKGGLEAAKILEDLKITSIHHVNLNTIHGQINSSALVHFVNHTSGNETNWSDSTPKNLEKLITNLSNSELQEVSEFSGPYMNPEELQELNSLNHVVIGDHLLNHWYTNSLTNTEVLENLSRVVGRADSKSMVMPFFAAPHGDLDLQKMELIRNQGYEVIFSGSSWTRSESATVIPRIDVNNSINSKYSLFGAIAILILRSKISKN
jgi:hypothetical protein